MGHSSLAESFGLGWPFELAGRSPGLPGCHLPRRCGSGHLPPHTRCFHRCPRGALARTSRPSNGVCRSSLSGPSLAFAGP